MSPTSTPKTPNSKPPPSSSKTRPPSPATDATTTRSRFEAYNRLQAAAVAFGKKLLIPEIVPVSGQSDGKSSLLEALLGFRFNVREVEMGTRRPLVLQMIHYPSALEPWCRFQVGIIPDTAETCTGWELAIVGDDMSVALEYVMDHGVRAVGEYSSVDTPSKIYMTDYNSYKENIIK